MTIKTSILKCTIDCYCPKCEEKIFTAFACRNCGFDTLNGKEYYMVENSIWETVHPQDDGMLCIGCVESKLGRELSRKDFTDAPINSLTIWGGKSVRLADRLQRLN